jgi:hypothetical protein
MQAKGDIREILDRLAEKHGATVRDVTVARIWIRPVPFAAWCKGRNVSPDQAARFTFVNEAAQHPPSGH